MGRITTTIPDDLDEEMRQIIIDLIGIRSQHGAITKFVSFAVENLLSQLKEGNGDLKQKLLEALGGR